MLTIVIPVYNRAAVVGRTLESIARQTYRPFRLVLVDNASTDGTAEVLKGWKECLEQTGIQTDILCEPKRGAAAARNAGLRAVATDWVMFFDSDDEMLPDHLRRVADAIKDHPEADIIGWDTKAVGDGANGKRLVFSDKDMWYMNLTQSIFATQRYAVRTDLVRRAGGWAEDLTMGDDVEMGMRLLAHNPVVHYDKGEPTVLINYSGDSITAATDIGRYMQAMERIRSLMPENLQHFVDFQIIARLNTWGKGNPGSRSAIESIIANGGRRRLLLRTADIYTRIGGRGLMRIIRKLSR